MVGLDVDKSVQLGLMAAVPMPYHGDMRCVRQGASWNRKHCPDHEVGPLGTIEPFTGQRRASTVQA
jgi:hypothetical protein